LLVDRAIPVAGVPALHQSDRAFEADHRILQRERKQGVAGWLWGTAGSVVLVCCAILLLLLGSALARLSRGELAPRRTTPSPPRAARKPATAGVAR
jgi:hypothetical protein